MVTKRKIAPTKGAKDTCPRRAPHLRLAVVLPETRPCVCVCVCVFVCVYVRACVRLVSEAASEGASERTMRNMYVSRRRSPGFLGIHRSHESTHGISRKRKDGKSCKRQEQGK